jgi:hypothetical protein
MNNYGKPRCHVCGREVEAFIIEESYAIDKIVMIAQCHGDEERVTLDFKDVAPFAIEIGGPRIEFGEAFLPKPESANDVVERVIKEDTITSIVRLKTASLELSEDVINVHYSEPTSIKVNE